MCRLQINVEPVGTIVMAPVKKQPYAPTVGNKHISTQNVIPVSDKHSASTVKNNTTFIRETNVTITRTFEKPKQNM